jgi:hypothetical protein
MFRKISARLAIPFVLLALISTLVGSMFIYSGKTSDVTAADDCQMFNETGFAVCGKFLTYWRANGGLAQQGFPISGVMDEQNQPPPAGDGKVHKVQYFQRARFEEHLENAAPYDVLLGLLGAEQLQARKSPVVTQPPTTTPPATQAPTQAPTTQAITIRSTRYQASISSQQPKAGYRFLVVDLVLTNTSSKEISTNILFFEVTTDKLYSFSGDFASFSLDKYINLKTLQPGDSAAGEIAFEIPGDENPKTISYDSYGFKAKVNF